MNIAAPARIALLATLVAAAACSSKDAASNSPAADAGATPATPAPDIASGAEPTANDISNYRLDMDKMRKYVAAIKGFSRLSASDSMAAEAMATDGNESTAQMIAKLNAHPVARRVLADAGLNAKDYVWITAAWLQAAMTEGILSSTPGAKMPEGQNMQNVDFMRQHKAELEAMMKDAGMKD